MSEQYKRSQRKKYKTPKQYKNSSLPHPQHLGWLFCPISVELPLNYHPSKPLIVLCLLN